MADALLEGAPPGLCKEQGYGIGTRRYRNLILQITSECISVGLVCWTPSAFRFDCGRRKGESSGILAREIFCNVTAEADGGVVVTADVNSQDLCRGERQE